MGLKQDYTVKPMKHHEARPFIARHHYSGGSSCFSSVTFGMFEKNTGALMGVAHWMPPARGVCVHFGRSDIYNLSRLVVHPSVPKNGASFLIGACMRQIKKSGKAGMLVTYADQAEGHTGAIYRATNWQYDGLTKPAWRWQDENGVMRSSLAHRVKDMKERGWVRSGPFHKHRFVYYIF